MHQMDKRSEACLKMKKYKILITEPLPEVEFGLKLLEDIAEIRYIKKFSGEVLAKDIRDVDAIIAGDSKISKKSLEGVQRLKVIGRYGVGVDSVDLDACTKKGVLVFNIPQVEGSSVPEHVIGMIIAISKKFMSRDRLVRSGRWRERHQLIGDELWNKTLGIIGLGNIGYLVAKMAEAFNMNVLAYDPYVSNEKAKGVSAQVVDLKTLLKESDYISINCPLTDETRGMICEKELRLMKSSAVLVNAARGGIVKDDALYRALKEGWIAGAGIDVLENEPVSKHPLFNLDNVLLTPHSAAWTTDGLRRVAIVTCENILKVLKGQLPKNVVNTEVLQHIR